MAFDYKKEYKEFYLPKNKPSIVDVPRMNYVAVRGKGDPNAADGDYQRAMSILYAVSFTIKMSYKGDHRIDGYFEYVVPPLEGFWWQDGVEGINYADKSGFNWVSAIRLPEFVAPDEFKWAIGEVERKKGIDCSKAEFLTVDEGLCVQMMHLGSYDDEPASVALMDAYAKESGYVLDLSDTRRHHEIYLSDPRRCAADKLKTVIRHPIRKV